MLKGHQTMSSANHTNGASEQREIRVVTCLSSMADSAAVYGAYSGTGRIRFATQANTIYEIEQKVAEQDASVVLIDSLSVKDDRARTHLATIITNLRSHPAHPIVVIGIAYEASWALTFEAAGALGVVNGPLGPLAMEQVTQGIASAMAQALLDRQAGMWASQISPETARMLQGRGVHHQIVAVWSAKGGVGKSFIAFNLAYALGVMADEPTLLIDADMNAGDIGTYAQADVAKGNIYQLAHAWKQNNRRMDKGMLRQQIQRVRGQFDVLCGAHDMRMTGDDGLRDEAFAQGLCSSSAGLGYTFVIWDLGQNYFEPLHYTALTRSTRNLIVATTELSTARELVPALNGLRESAPGEVTPERYRLVLNKWTANPKLDAKQLQKLTGLAEFGRVPHGDYEKVTEGLNAGRPAVLENDAVGNALLSLASGMHPALTDILNRRLGKSAPGKVGLKGLFARKAVAGA
jgi:cellulose biosynthesis protein BcsQ